MLVLGIESSCDETGLAIYSEQDGLLGHLVNSQVDLFTEYGGVIPEIAARDHSVKIIHILKELLKKSKLDVNDISLVTYTAGPGLIGSLMVGETVAKTISAILNKELLPINHLEGHILAPALEDSDIKPPYLCLLVSGGHTQIIECKDYGEYQILGETIDDACGEAFDKVGKLLGLEYPGGPKVSKLAEGESRNVQIIIKKHLKTSETVLNSAKKLCEDGQNVFLTPCNDYCKRISNLLQNEFKAIPKSVPNCPIHVRLFQIEKCERAPGVAGAALRRRRPGAPS